MTLEAKAGKFERIQRVRLPFDRRHEDPKKNYGIHGFDIWFILKGPKGATQFMFSIHSFLPHIEREERPKWIAKGSDYKKTISGYDVGYHSLIPQYEDHAESNCDLFPGQKCYYDGSSLLADKWVQEIFSIRDKHPDERVWEMLEEEYNYRFERDEKNV